MSNEIINDKPPMVEGYMNPKCSLCPEPATVFWPAYDQVAEPKPYCSKCLEVAKQTVEISGPRKWTVPELRER